MATSRGLRQRWTTPDGRQRASRITSALRERAFKMLGREEWEISLDEAGRRELIAILNGFTLTAEVAPALDLRGIEFESAVHFMYIDLADVRLDFATLGGNIWGCRARGASLKKMRARNKSLQHDFRGANFDGASLKGCYFGKTIVDGASFFGAKLQTAEFVEASCCGATFLGADMRLAHCPRADFSGADLSGVDMTEATMGGVKFDDRTRLAGTILRGASMNDDFRAFAEKAGAILGPDQNLLLLASLDATKKFLEGENADGSLDGVLRHLVSLRRRLTTDGSFVWEDELLRQTPPNLASTVEFAISQGSKNVASQLD